MPDKQIPERHKQIPERLTSEQRREAARAARRRWAAEVHQALAERGLSVHACARQAGISPGALQAWLNQDVEPTPRAMEQLARVLGRSHFRLVSLLGWLPEELGDVALRLEATEKLQEALAEAGRWVEAATAVVGFSGGSIVANAMLDASDDWEVLLRHVIRGNRHQVRHVTAAAFSPVDAIDEARSPDPSKTEADRERIEKLISDAIRKTGATWSSPARVGNWHWAKRRDLVLEAPVLLASKARGLRPNLVVPPSILVVGLPFSGAPDVGSLLATVLDWSYTHLKTAAQLSFGIGGHPEDEVGAQIEVARRLLQDSKTAARRMVWACDAADPILETFSEIGNELPLVVFLEVPEPLITYVERRTPRVSRGRVKAAQDLVRGTIATRDPRTNLTLRLPDLPIPDDEFYDVDAFFDAYVDLALKAAVWLQEIHGGPALDEAPGVLGDLWRTQQS